MENKSEHNLHHASQLLNWYHLWTCSKAHVWEIVGREGECRRWEVRGVPAAIWWEGEGEWVRWDRRWESVYGGPKRECAAECGKRDAKRVTRGDDGRAELGCGCCGRCNSQSKENQKESVMSQARDKIRSWGIKRKFTQMQVVRAPFS